MMTDPIADMLTRIRNAYMVRKQTVTIPYSKFKYAILSILKKEGYIEDISVSEAMPKVLVATLRYDGKHPHMQSIKRESTPGHRVYRKAEELPKILNGYGIAIISTPQGLMTDKEARKAGLGGEFVCSVY